MAKRQITARQARFADEYLIDLNATQAAIRAGYSAKTAASQGERLLRNVEVAAAVRAAKAARAEKTGITQERVLAELELLAFSDIDHYVVDDDGQVTVAAGAPRSAKRAIASIKRKRREWSDGKGDGHTVEVEVELKFWDKPGNLKLAGRHVGLFPDRVELTGKDGQPLDSSVARVTFMLPDNGRRSVPRDEGEGDEKKPKP